MSGNAALDVLRELAGVWRGSGVSHDGEPFLATFEVRGAVAGRGIALSFEARTEDKQLLHAEELLCVAGDTPLAPGRAVHVSSDGPPLMLAVEANDGAVEIRTETLDTADLFRMRERIGRDADGDLAVVWEWGLPGEPFAERSRVTLTRS